MVHRHPDKETELYVDDLAVSPAFRRQGVATRLLRACIGHGRDAGADAVWLATEVDNDTANEFFGAIELESKTALIFDGSVENSPDGG